MELVDSKHFELVCVKEGIYAAIAKEGSGSLGNAGFIDLGDSLLIFDTFFTPQAAEDLRSAAEALVAKPIAYVVNSHWHGDHVFGNQVFPEAEIVSTTLTHETMKNKNTEFIEYFKGMLPDYIQKTEAKLQVETDEQKQRELELEIRGDRELLKAVPLLRNVLPTITFDHRMVIHGSKRSVELISYGGGHTISDSFLYIPEEQIAFMGDLVQVDHHPLCRDGNPKEWLDILTRVELLGLQTIIPGHGQVAGEDSVRVMRDYFQQILEVANGLVKSGVTPEQETEFEIPVVYKGWKFSGFYAATIQQMYTLLVEQAVPAE